MTRTITNEQATYLHNAAVAANYPADALRINYYRIGGGGMETLLSVPGNDNAPCYRRNAQHDWEHVSGATIDSVAVDMSMDWLDDNSIPECGCFLPEHSCSVCGTRDDEIQY